MVLDLVHIIIYIVWELHNEIGTLKVRENIEEDINQDNVIIVMGEKMMNVTNMNVQRIVKDQVKAKKNEEKRTINQSIGGKNKHPIKDFKDYVSEKLILNRARVVVVGHKVIII